MTSPLPYQKGDLYEGFMNKLKKKGLARTNDFYVKIELNENIARLPFENRQRFTSEDQREISFMCKSASLPKHSIKVEDFVEKPSVVTKIAHYREESQVLPMTFYCGPDLWERKFFEKWMNYAIDPITYTPNYYNEYAKFNNITLFVLPKTFSGQMVLEGFTDYISTTDLQSTFNGSPIGGGSFINTPQGGGVFGGGTPFASSNNFQGISDSLRSNNKKGAGSGEKIYYVKFFECYPISLSEVQMTTSNDSAAMEFNVEISYKYFQTITDLEFSPLKDDVL